MKRFYLMNNLIMQIGIIFISTSMLSGMNYSAHTELNLYQYLQSTEGTNYLFSITATDSSDTLMVKLQTGNYYQYGSNKIQTQSVTDWLYTEKIIHDSTMNGLKYFSFGQGQTYYFRFDDSSNILYWRYGNNETMYCDFNLPNNTTFNQINPRTNLATTYVVKRGTKNIFGRVRKIFKITYNSTSGDSKSETFLEGIGFYSKECTSWDPFTQCIATLLSVILYDSVGNQSYYSHSYLPTMISNGFPNIQIGKPKFFEITVNHPLNTINYYYGLMGDGIVYVDTVYMEYYNADDSLAVHNKFFVGDKIRLNPKYQFNISIDTTAFRPQDRFKYRFIAKDKALIPNRVYLPANGYFTAIATPIPSDVEEVTNQTTFSLSQNYPNPFNPSTKIKFTIPAGVETRRGVSLRIIDILGKEIATLVNEEKPAGEYEVEFDGSLLPSGVYFYQLKFGSQVSNRKMILIK